MGYQVIGNGVRSWASIIDGATVAQASRANDLPVMAGPVALMPDAHLGLGATVGSVLATDAAIIPAAVGVDIGCGMVAARTTLTAEDLPDDLTPLLHAFEQRIPAGVGQGHAHTRRGSAWLADNPLDERSAGDTKLARKAVSQLGTLGSGNHFGEVCLARDGRVWIVLHSGSRGPGNQLAQRHIATAKRLARDLELALEDPDLAWFVEGTPAFEAYIADLLWAQDYARANREAMVATAVAALGELVDRTPEQLTHGETVVNCHHNYAAREAHDGRSVWVTRKGAINADADRLGVIPGSMGDRSYIVRGLGNAESWRSAPHGAGRLMSRRKARETFDDAALAQAMGDRTWLADRAGRLTDEHPGAYKPIGTVIADSADLVEVVEELVQVLNFKGT